MRALADEAAQGLTRGWADEIKRAARSSEDALPDRVDRAITVDVLGLPDDRQVLLGQLPLEALDFWIDVVKQRLVGNPEHWGQWMAEVF